MQGLLGKIPRLLFIAIAGAIALGCPDSAHKKATTQISGKPALELRKAVSFALSTTGLPDTKQGLIDAINAGLQNSVKLDPKIQTVQAEGDHYPTLKQLQVDLTNTQLDTGKKPVKLKKENITPGIRADQFAFHANPLKIDGGAVNLNVEARNVDLGILHDRNDRPVLSLSSARNGTVDCSTTTADLSTIFRASANERGRPVGLFVHKALIKLTSENDHDLSADVRFASTLVIVPIQLHFTAHVTVDPDNNIKLSNLTCDGDDAAGTLITQFIRPTLQQYNDKTMPLVAFPNPNIHLHDVSIKVDQDKVHLNAAFGS